MLRMSFKAALGAVTAVLLHAAVVSAQPPPKHEVGFLVGPAFYQLSTRGTTVAINLNGAIKPVSVLYVEGGMTYLDYAPRFEEPFAPRGTRDRRLFPEVSAQMALPLGRVCPYLGAGAGLSVPVGSARSIELGPTLLFMSGLRVYMSRGWAVRGELRIRSIDPFGFATVDVMFGGSKRIGS
jgi:hypothetical protein